MKAKLSTLTLAALLALAGTANALAHDDKTEGGSLHWITHLTSVKGHQGQAAEMKLTAAPDYGEGTSLINMNQSVKDKGQLAGNQVFHGENEEGTATFHAAHPR